MAARTVVIASPNSVHFKDFRKRDPPPVSLFVKAWTLEELLAALPFVNPALKVGVLVERWRQQGGNPRAVFKAHAYDAAVARTNGWVGKLSRDVLRRIYSGVAGEEIEEKDVNSPNSSVATYVHCEPPFNKPIIGFISKAVQQAVESAVPESTLRQVKHALPEEMVALGQEFERATVQLLGSGGVFRVVGTHPQCRVAAMPMSAGCALRCLGVHPSLGENFAKRALRLALDVFDCVVRPGGRVLIPQNFLCSCYFPPPPCSCHSTGWLVVLRCLLCDVRLCGLLCDGQLMTRARRRTRRPRAAGPCQVRKTLVLSTFEGVVSRRS